MRTMVDLLLDRWLVGFTIDRAPKDCRETERVGWTGLTLYVGPLAFGLWVKSTHLFGKRAPE